MGMRKCSQCGRSGHNSRTCRIRVLGIAHQSMKLFGVELELMSNNNTHHHLHHHHGFSFSPHSQLLSHHHHHHRKPTTTNAAAYLSLQAPRKKGVPWSEEEHKLFLVGLQQLGRGDWRGISRNFVTSRTSTQVASHAQKYFLRQNNPNKNKHTPTILTMVERKEAQVEEDDEFSISVGMFPKLAASTADYYCTHTRRQPIAPVPEIPDCRLLNNLATQNAPSLELSLQPPVSVCKI
ncbi:UNVERIFIED_CONTAM: Transcription factor MYBS3 [Sesamum latifolium]|uniref:Transcription factor MYBS3 n=1 Tax=Sesamum latifolium TaxID=2727402 RepID=A0AAW2X285_9LAMI